MRPVQFTALVLWFFIPFAVLANCDARNDVWTHFSDPVKQDKFSVVINGANCADLTQTIRIHSAENELLYIHSSAFIDGTREQISKQFIEFLVQFTLHENFFDLTNNLPSWGKLRKFWPK